MTDIFLKLSRANKCLAWQDPGTAVASLGLSIWLYLLGLFRLHSQMAKEQHSPGGLELGISTRHSKTSGPCFHNWLDSGSTPGPLPSLVVSVIVAWVWWQGGGGVERSSTIIFQGTEMGNGARVKCDYRHHTPMYQA